MVPIRLLIVDDSTTIRAMLEEVLGRAPGIVLVGSAPDAATALLMVRELHPDVTTIDVAMPGTDGISLLDQIRDLTHPVMLSSHIESTANSFEHGALGFFDKNRIFRESGKLIQMVERAAEGRKTRPVKPR